MSDTFETPPKKKKKNQSQRRWFVTGALSSLLFWLPVGFTIVFLRVNERVMVEPIHQSVTVLFSQQAYLISMAIISLIVMGIYLWLMRTSKLFILGIVALIPLVIGCWMAWVLVGPRIHVADEVTIDDTTYLAVMTSSFGHGEFNLYECIYHSCLTHEVTYRGSSSFRDGTLQLASDNQIIAEVDDGYDIEICQFDTDTREVECV